MLIKNTYSEYHPASQVFTRERVAVRTVSKVLYKTLCRRAFAARHDNRAAFETWKAFFSLEALQTVPGSCDLFNRLSDGHFLGFEMFWIWLALGFTVLDLSLFFSFCCSSFLLYFVFSFFSSTTIIFLTTAYSENTSHTPLLLYLLGMAVDSRLEPRLVVVDFSVRLDGSYRTPCSEKHASFQIKWWG